MARKKDLGMGAGTRRKDRGSGHLAEFRRKPRDCFDARRSIRRRAVKCPRLCFKGFRDFKLNARILLFIDPFLRDGDVREDRGRERDRGNRDRAKGG